MSQSTPERRRVRAARSTLARIEQQRATFAIAYGAAGSPQQRFNTVAASLRAAIAGRKQRHPVAVEDRLEAVTAQLTGLLEELHTAQQQAAEHTIHAEYRRQHRNERRAAA